MEDLVLGMYTSLQDTFREKGEVYTIADVDVFDTTRSTMKYNSAEEFAMSCNISGHCCAVTSRFKEDVVDLWIPDLEIELLEYIKTVVSNAIYVVESKCGDKEYRFHYIEICQDKIEDLKRIRWEKSNGFRD